MINFFGKENILSEEHYKNGELDGVSKVWNDYVDLIYEKHYKNGELDGVSSMWDSNGPSVEDTKVMLNGIVTIIDMTLEEAELIKTFEVKHKATQPWLFRG